MDKDIIFRQRRELKKKSHAVVKGHYFVLAFLMLIMVLFGTEFSHSLSMWGRISGTEVKEDDPGNILSADDVIYTKSDVESSDDVLDMLLAGRFAEGVRRSEELSKEFENDQGSSKTLGRSRGVLAQAVNIVGSGRLFVMFLKTIRTITRSEESASLIFIGLSFLLYLLVFMFLKRVYSAVVRRVFLQARIYQKVSFLDVTYIAAVRKWAQASWTMMVMYVRLILWSLTIVGGIIKSYSYWAVPYIVAENPGISAKKAILLSRKMMDGHKWELFKYEISLLGWIILGIVTFGISDLAYGLSYRMACYSEFYAKVREEAFERRIEGTELLNDPYLFAVADRILLYETYFDVVDEITVLHENKMELTGWRKVIADWFGIWVGSIRRKKAYDDYEGRLQAISRYKESMAGKTYPLWLSPLWRKKELEKLGNFNYLRHYTVWTLFLLFVFFCFVGWAWEVALHLMQTGEFANRGTLHGPWLPIYGTGGIIVLLLCSRFRKNPVVEFFTAIVLCGFLEYFSGWYLETRYHQRWWSYDGYFLNLHGRICAEGLLVFGVGCCVVVYLVAPVFDFLLMKIKAKVLIGISLVLFVIYGADVVYSGKHPNMAKGAVEASEPEENMTEALSEELLSETDLPEAG